MKSKLEILQETIEAYSKPGTRASNGTACFYYETKTGNRCAFGRCCSEENAKTLVSHRYGTVFDFKTHIDDFLLPEYRGHDAEFWRLIQRLHDNDENWNKDGSLTGYGKKFVDFIIETIPEKIL